MTGAAAGASLRTRALWAEYFTISWNLIEAVVAVGAGIVASSIALVGFGFDSSIESFAAGVVIWQLRGIGDEGRERRAMRLIAISFFVLAGYVTVEALRNLVTSAQPESSLIGIWLAAISLVVMPTLGFVKKRLASTMDNQVLRADAAETFLCAWLSAILLAGLALNAWLGWWWADPIAALAIAALALREGKEAWETGSQPASR